MSDVIISKGFDADERQLVAHLYWQAFGAKLARCLGPEAKAQAFLVPNLNPDYALTARDPAGRLLGVAGFKTSQGALADAGVSDLCAAYGSWGGLWRAALLALLEREAAATNLLMDGIFVAPHAQGRGVGTALLEAIKAEAHNRGLAAVRLDVIDSNTRARTLYEREGFVAVQTHHLGPLRFVFGFRSATTMTYALGHNLT